MQERDCRVHRKRARAKSKSFRYIFSSLYFPRRLYRRLSGVSPPMVMSDYDLPVMIPLPYVYGHCQKFFHNKFTFGIFGSWTRDSETRLPFARQI